jgi:hypothetical protein
MAKEEGVKVVVVGGKNDVQQEYCGTVGGAALFNFQNSSSPLTRNAPQGQSADFSSIDTEIKVRIIFTVPSVQFLTIFVETTQLKNSSLAPPDLCVSSIVVCMPFQWLTIVCNPAWLMACRASIGALALGSMTQLSPKVCVPSRVNQCEHQPFSASI